MNRPTGSIGDRAQIEKIILERKKAAVHLLTTHNMVLRSSDERPDRVHREGD
jgi:hypothetical protein